MGHELAGCGTREGSIHLRRNLQMVFQDPYASLNPRWRAFDSIAEPLRTHRLAKGKRAVEERVVEMLRLVGLSPEDGRKFPHQFSGGQRQRISIARALSAEPAFIIADEPTSALDVSVQAQILNLMRDLQARLGLTYLFISHNLAVVSNMANVIGVLYLGTARRDRTGGASPVPPAPPLHQAAGRRRPRHLRHRQTARTAERRHARSGRPAGRAAHSTRAVPLRSTVARPRRPLLRAFDGVQVACHRAEDMRAASGNIAAFAPAVQSAVSRRSSWGAKS